MSRWEQSTSRSLEPFINGEPLPYTSSLGIAVTTATPVEGAWGSPSRGSAFHLVESAATAWEDHGPVFGARWICGGSSIGAQFYIPEVFADALGRKALPENLDEMTCWKCRSVRDGTDTEAQVYRVFDRRRHLLYIGSTKNLPARLRQHKRSTWWWQLAKDVESVTYSTLEKARDAEREAIRSEGPQMNVQHNKGQVIA